MAITSMFASTPAIRFLLRRTTWGAAAIVLLTLLSGCRLLQPGVFLALKMELGPAENRPKNWPHFKKLVIRAAPTAGDPAPDFTVACMDGQNTITRSTFQAGRPLVLIFGSFT